MLRSLTPEVLLRNQLGYLRDRFPAVLDGEPSGIHDARTATRRIRELLRLVGGDRRLNNDDLRRRFRRLGRSLGRVRDADVRVALLASLEQRIPHAAPALVVVRQQRERQRLELMRKLIKRLERLDAVALVESLDGRGMPRIAAFGWHSDHRWRRRLEATVKNRAQAAQAAITHATGVYFPKRTHAARIAIKKLRYALEVVHDTRTADESHALADLKKAQDVLGDLHDQQELIDHLAADSPHDDADAAAQVALIRQVVEAEARRLHGRYLQRRERLLVVCDTALAHAGTQISVLPVVAITAAALSTGTLVVRKLNGGIVRGH